MKAGRRKSMQEWNLALKVFVFGFSGVFVTLALLMVSIFIAGAIGQTRKKDNG
jgi:ABC-type arginine/histidine transport system permease subunit